MDKADAVQFQQKIDEVLKDTEEFVNAARQLRQVKASLDNYIASLSTIESNVSGIAKNTADCANYAAGFFNGDFTKEIEDLFKRINGMIETCSDSVVSLKKQYDEILNADNYKELQSDHSMILDVIDDLKSSVDQISDRSETNSGKIDEMHDMLYMMSEETSESAVTKESFDEIKGLLKELIETETENKAKLDKILNPQEPAPANVDAADKEKQ